jgi:hypothetical protein
MARCGTGASPADGARTTTTTTTKAKAKAKAKATDEAAFPRPETNGSSNAGTIVFLSLVKLLQVQGSNQRLF